jgi:signal transduction histidine kinase
MTPHDRVRVTTVDAPRAVEALEAAAGDDGSVVVVDSSLAAVDRARPDCVVLGDPTPDRVRRLRRAAPGASVLALADDEGREAALDAGARDVLDPSLVADDPALAARRVVDAARAAAFGARRRVVDAASDATAVVGTDGRLWSVDERFASLVDRSASDLVGRPATEALDGRHVDLLLGAAEGAVEERDTVVAFEHETDAGRRFESRVAPVAVDETLHAAAVALRDVTDRAVLSAELGRREQRLEEVASLVSHDLRNPLNVVSGRLQLAEETGDVSHVEPALRATLRLCDLVEDIQALARLGRRVTEAECDPLDLAFAARVAWGSVDPGSATLDADDAEGTTVEVDEERLLALLRELFENAAAHAGPDATVRVAATATGFVVDDDGPGFSADTLDRGVDPGYTTDDDRTGFGLAKVVAVADAHGWRVRLDTSDAGGARVAFTVEDVPTLP